MTKADFKFGIITGGGSAIGLVTLFALTACQPAGTAETRTSPERRAPASPGLDDLGGQRVMNAGANYIYVKCDRGRAIYAGDLGGVAVVPNAPECAQ